MSELFSIPESLSPRLRWIAAHGILSHHSPHCPESPWMALKPVDADKGKAIGDIMAESCCLYDEAGMIGYGMTEADAILDLAVNLNLPLWNEA